MPDQVTIPPKAAKRVRRLRWLVTGAAGFIGSHLVETLLAIGAQVKSLDNFEVGRRENLETIKDGVEEADWARFTSVEGDIRDFDTCLLACENIDVVVHLAALGSVPSSLRHPNLTTDTNVGGFVNLLTAAKDSGVRRFVYASSCAVYGDNEIFRKSEDHPARPLSPYALSKRINEEYATLFGQCYQIETVGLRFFNVYGPRQDSGAAHVGVIPTWTSQLSLGHPVQVNGDGETTRDFCHVTDVVRACLLAGVALRAEGVNQVYNVGSGVRTSLNQLIDTLVEVLRTIDPATPESRVEYRDFRPGDIRHSVADISKARKDLGFEPMVSLREGLTSVARGLRTTKQAPERGRRVGVIARGSAQDGLGHFMRARAVATAMAEEGAEVTVLLRGEQTGNVLFRHAGLPVRFCDTDEDAAACLEGWRPDVTVFDTLTFSAASFGRIAALAPTVSLSPVFDQLDRVDHLFHRTVHENPEWSSRVSFPKIHKGLEYSVISERCRQIPRPVFQRNLRQSPLSIAISMGGADAPNRTLDILQGLASANCSLLIWVLLGEAYTHSYEALVTAVRGSRHEVILVKSNESMWRVLESVCLIVCSGGMTTYEAAFAGLPSLNLPLHGDRHYLLAELETRGACKVMQESRAGFPEVLHLIERLECNREELLKMRDIAAAAIPPHGASRVAIKTLALSSM